MRPRSEQNDDRISPRTTLNLFESGRNYLLTADAVWIEPGVVHFPGWLSISNGFITGSGQGTAPPYPEAVAIDLGALYLTPGLIDAHVHLELNPIQHSQTRIEEKIEQAVNSGLAGVRDGGDRAGRILRARSMIETSLYLAASGWALNAPGRYGSFLSHSVSNRAEMITAVKDLVQSGADQIKVLVSGPVSLETFGRVGPQQFSSADLSFLADLAREADRPLMIHANGQEAVTSAAKAGATSVEHGYFMGPDALELLAAVGIAWIPTIVPLAALTAKEVNGDRRRLIQKIIRDQQKQLVLARELRVKLVMGTDAGSPGVPIGQGIFQEMALWLEAGLTPAEVISAATASAAELLGWESRLGRLTPGHLAIVVGFPRTSRQEPDLTRAPVFVGRPGGLSLR